MTDNKPAFLGIGAHKAGTSWLYTQLAKHPDVYMPPKKEIHFFDRSPQYLSPNTLAVSSPILRLLTSDKWDISTRIKDLLRIVKYTLARDFDTANWYKKWSFGYCDEDWYRDLFSHTRGVKTCGEITPDYSMLKPEDVSIIKAINPDMKFIFMLRNPVERAWSMIRYGSGRGRLEVNLASTDEIIYALQQPGVILRGDYEKTLDTYLQQFDSSQFLVCFYDAIKHNPTGLMNDIAKFLQVDPFPQGAINATKRVNASKPRPMPNIVREYLLETYAPSIERISESFGSYASLWQGSKIPVLSGNVNNDFGSADNSLKLPPTVHP